MFTLRQLLPAGGACMGVKLIETRHRNSRCEGPAAATPKAWAPGTLNVLMCGSGEYTTGFTPGEAAPDKKAGVVGLVMFDLRRRGKVGRVGCVGTNGTKFPQIRDHVRRAIAEGYKGMDVTMDTYPADNVGRDPEAYKAAIDALKPGDAVTIFTPDDTHFDIAMYAIERGVHVLLTKPAVMTVRAHKKLMDAAKKKGVLVQIEFHKRWDPIYADARQRINENLGDFQFFQSYMSQPQNQLYTFKAWAGKSSDISYYLNSHHIDVHCWSMEGKAIPLKVSALGATGVAQGPKYGCPEGTEDTITLLVEWKNIASGNKGIAIYTSGWAAPENSEVHSQQKFTYLGHEGELRADQAHRGYEVCTGRKYANVNPLYMKYTKDAQGYFAGQRGYGYLSLESFVDNCRALNSGETTLDGLNAASMPTLDLTLEVTAILEAGRRSLDDNGAWIDVQELMRNPEGGRPISFQPKSADMPYV